MNQKVAIIKTKEHHYPEFPYHPATKYPEYLFEEYLDENYVYDSIREAFHLLGYDQENFGKAKWNPLSEIIKQNDTIVIKPNFVEWKENDLDFYAVITHCSIIRAVVDYVLIALNNTGKIIIAESVQNSTDYLKIIKRNRILDLIAFYKTKGFTEIELRDARNYKGLSLDPDGYTQVNLKEESLYATWPKKKLRKLYGADYNRKETMKAHTNGNNIYELANTFLNADVLITIPKMKTHAKAGITLSLKSFIGMMGNKNLIPHRSISSPKRNGDSYPDTIFLRTKWYLRWDQFFKELLMTRGFSKLYSFCRKAVKIAFRVKQKHLVITQGKWSGNNTLWQAIVDISNIWLKDKKRYFAIIDGVIAGDKDGPVNPRPREEGIVVVGEDFILIDIATTYLMGIDPQKVKYLKYFIEKNKIDYNMIKLESNIESFRKLFTLSWENTLKFEPIDAWKDIKLE